MGRTSRHVIGALPIAVFRFPGALAKPMGSPPPTAPAATETAPTSNQPDDEEKDNRAYGGVHDGADRPAPKMDAQARQQPVTDESADDPDGYIPDQAITGSPHDLPGQPPGDKADKHDDNEAFIRQMHGGYPPVALNCALGAHTRTNYPKPIVYPRESQHHRSETKLPLIRRLGIWRRGSVVPPGNKSPMFSVAAWLCQIRNRK
jgi:hypothetical protein